MTRNRNFPICGIRQQQRRPVRTIIVILFGIAVVWTIIIADCSRRNRRGIEKNKTGITVAGILGGLAIVLITIIRHHPKPEYGPRSPHNSGCLQ